MRQLRKVKELLDKGVIWVEDGNHGENRPLQNEFSSIGTPFIRPPDLMKGFVNFVDCDRINERARSRVRKGIGRAGDILFTHRATVGRIALAPKGAPEFVANPGVTVWRSLNHELLDIRYLYYFMQTSRFMDQVWSVAGSTDTFPYISLTQQRELDLELPEIEEQRIIGKVLGYLDDKIELNRRMNETLEAMAQAIFRDWFVDFGPTRRKLEGATDPLTIMVGLVQDAEQAQALADLFPAALGDDGLPEGWNAGRLDDLAEVHMGASPKGDTYNEDGVGTPLANGPVEFGDYFLVEKKWTTSPTRLSQVGDFVICVRGSTTGRHVFADGVYCLGRGVAALRGLPGEQDFVNATIIMHLDTLLQKTTGSVFPNLSGDDIRSFSCLVPPKSVRRQFSLLAEPLRMRIWHNVHENRTLSATRDLLLPKLMSGEIRLSEAEDLVEAAQ